MIKSLLFFCIVFFPIAQLHPGWDEPNPKRVIGEITKITAEVIAHKAPRRPYQLAYMNDSLIHLSNALTDALQGKSVDQVLSEAKLARDEFDDNYFTYLVEALLYERDGYDTEATQAFEIFLKSSQRYTAFEKMFITYEQYTYLRLAISQLLKSRGIHFEGREEEVAHKIERKGLTEFLIDPSRFDQLMKYMFPIVLLAGFVFFFYTKLSGSTMPDLIVDAVLFVYLFCWIAYGTWWVGLNFGLPFGWSRFYVVPTLLLFPLGVIGLLKALSFFTKSQEMPSGMRKCPHCGAEVTRLETVCSECNKLISA